MTTRRRPGSHGARRGACGWVALAFVALAIAMVPGVASAQEPAPSVDGGAETSPTDAGSILTDEAGSSAPAGGVGIALAEAPTDRADDPRARSAIVDHVQPGEIVRRSIRITNTTADDVYVSSYANAASLIDGVWTPADGRIQNELSLWTAVEPAVLTVPANGVALATVTIVVPVDAPDGERYATVWAEQPGVVSGGVRVVNRAGVRVYLSVGDGEEPASAFSIDEIRAVRRADGVQIETDVGNTGGRALDLSGSAVLEDVAASLLAGPFVGPTVTAGLGQAVTVDIPVPDATSPGPWEATVTIQAGLLRRVETVELVIPTEIGTYTVAGSTEPRAVPGEGFTPTPPPPLPQTDARPATTPGAVDRNGVEVAAPATSPSITNGLTVAAAGAMATVVAGGAVILLRPRLSILRSLLR